MPERLDFYYESQTLPRGARLVRAADYPEEVARIARLNERTVEEVLGWDGCVLNGDACHAYIVKDPWE